jgi:general secretion pathway protein K
MSGSKLPPERRAGREGMALLTVLLLVGVMSVVAVAVLDDVRFSVRRATNVETQAQAQLYADGVESLAQRQVARLMAADPSRTPLDPVWNGRPFAFPIEGGTVSAVVRDGQNCFNLNSVVLGQGEDLTASQPGLDQLIALGRAIDIPVPRMAAIADSLADWLDADPATRPNGAEDGAYAGLATPYRTSGVMLAEVSELRAIRGVDADIYRRLRPYVCALPVARPTVLNVNTLEAAQAPLLVMLTDGRAGLQVARAAIAARPPSGWASVDAFWSQPALVGTAASPDMREQTSLMTRFFDLRVDVDYGGVRAVRTALIHAQADGRARTVIQRWTLDE